MKEEIEEIQTEFNEDSIEDMNSEDTIIINKGIIITDENVVKEGNENE